MKSKLAIFLLSIVSLGINPPLFSQSGLKKPKKSDEKSFHFLVIGDWGRNGQVAQGTVAKELGKYNETFGAKFVMSEGDNFYCCGVASVDDPQWMSSFENVYNNQSLQIDWYAVLGNHDYEGNAQAEVDYTHKSRRWNMPARYYTVQKPIGKKDTALFVFLDTNPWIEKYLQESENYDHIKREWGERELAWLDSVLSHSAERWKIVTGHHPLYSTGTEHGNQPELIEKLKPLFDKYHVDAYFSGHEHDLQYQLPAGSTVNYFISGAGAEVRPTGSLSGQTKFSAAIPGFMAVSITEKDMVVKIIDEKGKTLYETTIPK